MVLQEATIHLTQAEADVLPVPSDTEVQDRPASLIHAIRAEVVDVCRNNPRAVPGIVLADGEAAEVLDKVLKRHPEGVFRHQVRVVLQLLLRVLRPQVIALTPVAAPLRPSLVLAPRIAEQHDHIVVTVGKCYLLHGQKRVSMGELKTFVVDRCKPITMRIKLGSLLLTDRFGVGARNPSIPYSVGKHFIQLIQSLLCDGPTAVEVLLKALH